MTLNKLNHVFLAALCVVLTAIFTGCGRYAISVNENTVYEPAPLFGEYSIADAALKTCVKHTIAEKRLTKAEQLKQLICPAGEVTSLEGLEIFTNLEHLGLAENRVTHIALLSQLTKLSRVNLRDNRVQNFRPLHVLQQLSQLDARGNSNADCSTLTPLTSSVKDIQLPRECE